MSVSHRRSRILGRLRKRKAREREGLVLVEGLRAVTEALDAGAEVRFAVTAPALRETPDGSVLLARLLALGADVDEVADGELAALSDTEQPQGVLMACAEPAASLDDLGPGRYLLLDALQDPGNAGTLVRAAVAFGVDGVLALDGTVDLWGAKAVRASAGMAFRTRVIHAPCHAVLDRLAALEVPVLVADASGQDVAGWRPGAAWALAVGNEGSGPRAEVAAASALALRIPMPGSAESLNAGVAGSILLYALTVRSPD
ncbi:MAG: RNA methyltransferase [Longimicrobiales bacterium]